MSLARASALPSTLVGADGMMPGLLRMTYEEAGCVVIGRPMLPVALMARASSAANALARGDYAEGRAPWRVLRGAEPGSLLKIDQPHLADRALFDVVTHPALGALAAATSGAQRIQAWATQLLIKPSGGGSAGCVGWHTDQQYWPWFRGGVLTVWVALEDVLPESGPVSVLGSSHRWPDGTFHGDAFCQDLASQERAWHAALSEPQRGALSSIEFALPAGAVAIFDGRAVHCSGPNRSPRARLGLAIHMRTEHAEVIPDLDPYGFTARLEDLRECPVIWGAE